MSDAALLLDHLDAAATRHQVLHGGRIVAWREFGSGPPLVLLHGGHGSWMHWVRNIPALSREHTLWLPDMPGYGDSDDLPAGLAPDQRLPALVAALTGTLDQLLGAQAPVALAGFSFGGLVATMLAVSRGRVDRLALLGTAGHGGLRREARAMINWRVDDRGAMLSALHHNLGALMLHDERQIDELAMLVHERSCVHTRFRSKALSRASPLPGLLEGFRSPLLLLWGEHDVTAHPDQVGPMLAAGRAERQWQVVPGAGHWVQYERPDETTQRLAHWFGPQRPT